jgi:hypothetical protein
LKSAQGVAVPGHEPGVWGAGRGSTELASGAVDMPEPKQNSPAKDWLEAELADTLDEDYELEMSEPALSMEIAKIYKNAHPPSINRMQ